MSWAAVVPVKPWQSAKSRLAMPSGLRAEVAEALTLDTLDALTSHPDIAHVVVVTSDAAVRRAALVRGATVLDEARTGSASPLNSAVLQGCRFVTEQRGDVRTVVVPADLAYLSPDVLTDALVALKVAGSAHIPDLEGTGTTLLAASAASAIDPHYGIDSSDLHARAGFRPLIQADLRIRTDVDQMNDLDLDSGWTVGPHLSGVLDRISLGTQPLA